MARSRSKKIDNLRWIGYSVVSNAQAAGAIGIAAISATSTPDTIMRTRGTLMCLLDGVNAPGVGAVVGIGMAVVPEGTGSTVLWSPLSDRNAPWFFYDIFTLAYEEAVVDAVAYQGASVYRAVMDSKAMRRSPPDTEVQVVFEQATTSGLAAAEINATVQGRVLVGN